MGMEPKFKKKMRKGDLVYQWEYEGYLIRSGSRGMYNMVVWAADKNGQPVVTASSLKRLCVEIDKREDQLALIGGE